MRRVAQAWRVSRSYWAYFSAGRPLRPEVTITGRFFTVDEALAAGVVDPRMRLMVREHLQQAYALARYATEPAMSGVGHWCRAAEQAWTRSSARLSSCATTLLKLHLTEDFTAKARRPSPRSERRDPSGRR